MIEGRGGVLVVGRTDDIDSTPLGVASRSQACLDLAASRSDQGCRHAEKPTAHTHWTSSERRSHYNHGCSGRRVSGIRLETPMQFPSCAVVPFTTPGGTGRAILTSEGVTVIESPPGTLTDRGVGDGSPWLKSNRPTATIIRQ